VRAVGLACLLALSAAPAIGLAEADPGARPNAIIIADRVDGAPLDAREGPYKMVIEGDLRGARAARMVRRITLVRVAAGN
jgi:hypothetical protein